MATIEAWGERLTPAFGDTMRRFAFPIVLVAVATALFVGVFNDIQSEHAETLVRAAFGAASAAIFATAGVFFAESRPRDRVASAILIFAVPTIAGVLFQIRDTSWFVPYALPVVGVLWLSVAAFTAREPDAEARFWWLNHRAVAAGAIAGLALGIICVGIVAIESTVATLFGLHLSDLIYKSVLPVVGLFFAPVYWLSTLPRLSDYDARVMTTPDFLARAVGLVGKFVLIPLLLAYAAILLLYAAQVVVTQKLPEGTLGWMVLGFVVTGAGTVLILYPPFIRDSAIVRFFQRAWFWLTILPLGLFFVAVFVRVDAYGFTPERLALMWAGLWAALLTVIFIVGRGDIRLIPGLAAVILLIATIGPWNVENLSYWQQGLKLDVLLSKAGPNGESLAGPSAWTAAERQEATGIIAFLSQGGGDGGRVELARVLRVYGYDFTPNTADTVPVMIALGIQAQDSEAVVMANTNVTASRDRDEVVDLSATPFFLGSLSFEGSQPYDVGPMKLRIYDDVVTAHPINGAPPTEDIVRVDLSTWIANQAPGKPIGDAAIDFMFGGVTYRFVAERVEIIQRDNEDAPKITAISGQLFAQTPPPAPETPTP